MNVLLIGSGGREHAILWKIKQSLLLKNLFTLPKNSVFAKFSKNFDIQMNDFESIYKLCNENKIDLVIVGPEEPLAKGISDYLSAKNINVFGPKIKGAILEASKQVAKEFMYRNYIPTADFKIFFDSEYAKEYLKKNEKFPVVIKADGLCAGKGVRVCYNLEEAYGCIKDFMEDRIFGSSSMKVIIEEYLEGRECSVLCFVDGKRYLMMPISKDHKRLMDGDKGPNTGGMGAIAPLELEKEILRQIEEDIIWRFMEAIIRERIDYRGVIYFGLMITKDGPKVLEFNVRFGDPETQAILPLLEEDLLELCYNVSLGKIEKAWLKIKKEKSVCVVLTSSGYPLNPRKGDEIKGLENVDSDIIVFHAGTKYEDGRYFTNGGRVLNIVGFGENFEKAREKVYSNISKINFTGMYFRKDIGISN